MREDEIVILSILQSYVLHWYHTYLLHPVINRTKSTIQQRLYWPGIRYTVRKKVTNCDNCQRTKKPNIKYGKLPAKEADGIQCNKLCVYLKGTCVIKIKGKKENLNIKSITMIYPVIG